MHSVLSRTKGLLGPNHQKGYSVTISANKYTIVIDTATTAAAVVAAAAVTHTIELICFHLATFSPIIVPRLLYYNIFGGVTSFRPDVFELVNGFSNEFYGWGGEDDDMFNR